MKLIELTDDNMKVIDGTAYYVAGDEKSKPKRRPAKKKAPAKKSRVAFAADLLNAGMHLTGRGMLVALFLLAMYLYFMGAKP